MGGGGCGFAKPSFVLRLLAADGEAYSRVRHDCMGLAASTGAPSPITATTAAAAAAAAATATTAAIGAVCDESRHIYTCESRHPPLGQNRPTIALVPLALRTQPID